MDRRRFHLILGALMALASISATAVTAAAQDGPGYADLLALFAEWRAKLEALVNDASTPDALKTLSTVILSLNHMPSAADKEKLAKIGS